MLAIFGARRQCTHVLNLLEWSGQGVQDILLFDNAYPDIQGPRGIEVLGKVPEGMDRCVRQSISGLVAMGSRAAAPRYSIYREAKAAGVKMASVTYDCRIAPSVTMGDNLIMMPGTTIGPGVRIGSVVMMFSHVVVEHDCKIEDNVTFGPGVVVAGDVTIRRHVFLGAGCVLKPGVTIGEGCLIGTGSVVCSDTPPGWVMAGVPARPLRAVREGDDAPILGLLASTAR
ncbi:MAG: acetyltransferase [Terriglobales bacterium]